MTFSNYLTSKRPQAQITLTEILQRYREVFKDEPWGFSVISQLENIIPKGKLTRYALTQLGYEGYSVDSSKLSEILGISLECVHTGLLFHDDIMDDDNKRRGNDALHIAYAKTYRKSSHDSQGLGKNLAICTADFAFSSRLTS